jgi:phage-related protein
MELALGCVQLENGRCPFLECLEELPKADQAKVLAWARRLAADENLRKPPYAKHLGDGIFELRLSVRSGEHRSFFFYCQGRQLVMTHGYVKKTDKTSSAEIERAKRLRSYYENTEPPPERSLAE